jgi:hypothetical protein
MVQLLGNTDGKARRKVNAKGGPASVKGRQNQVASRTVHGLRSRAPILVGLESAQEWFACLEGYRAYYKPVGVPEEDLVEIIAYQAWVIIQRLIPHECQVTLNCLQKPNQIIDPIDPEVIKEVMRHSAPTLSVPLKAELARLDRYEALGNGVDPQTPYAKAEVEELLGWLIERVRERTEEQNADQEGESDETVWEQLLDVDDGPWTAQGLQEHMQELCQEFGIDWREELGWVLYHQQSQITDRLEQIDRAYTHIQTSRILSREQVEALQIIERQKSSTLRNMIAQLERLQARRLGQPVLAPIAVGVHVDDVR